MCEHIRNKTRNVSPILEIENVGNFLLAQVRYSVLMHSVGCFPALFCLLVSYDHLSKSVWFQPAFLFLKLKTRLAGLTATEKL